MTDVFAPKSDEQVLRLVLGSPLAWVVAHDGEFRAIALPLRPRVQDGRIVALEGHMGRANPMRAALERSPRALILFNGPQGYISPSWVSDRTWAPTWNYAVVQYLVTVEFDETPARLDAHLHDLVDAMERGRPKAWHPSEMGERYDRLRKMIIPFEAKVVEQRAKFKMGQDERDTIFAGITAGLAESGPGELLAWMREMNPGR